MQKIKVSLICDMNTFSFKEDFMQTDNKPILLC